VSTGIASNGRNTGTPSLGGTIVTAGGVIFIAGTMDRRFRAFDAKTGDELWVTKLEASKHATFLTTTASDEQRARPLTLFVK
jgi:quinoprotein glucose dehydrogenase